MLSDRLSLIELLRNGKAYETCHRFAIEPYGSSCGARGCSIIDLFLAVYHDIKKG